MRQVVAKGIAPPQVNIQAEGKLGGPETIDSRGNP